MSKNIKYYISFEVIFYITSLVYSFKLTKFNVKLVEWLSYKGATSWLTKSLKMFEYQNGKAFQYLYGAVAIIFIACLLTTFFWIQYLRYRENDSMLLVSIMSSIFNICIVILTFILFPNVILCFFAVLSAFGTFIMYTMSI